MKITVISVGKIKEKYLEEGIKEYSKRLTKYVNLEFLEAKDEQAPENLSEREIEIILEKEGERILSKLKPSYLIALAIEGIQYSSEGLSKLIDEVRSYHGKDITFLIGGSLGLSKAVLERADLLLSFSMMTFPHQLMKLILLEQIYRSFRILSNEPYHK